MRKRLLLVFVGVVALVLLVHDLPLARHLESVERDRLVSKRERDAFIIALRSEEALEAGLAAETPAVRALVARYAFEEDVDVVIVDTSSIVQVASDEADLDADFSNREEIITALDGFPANGQRFSRTLGEELFFVAVPVYSGDAPVGAVRITAPARVVDERVRERVRGLFVVALISLAIATAAALLVATGVTRALRRLQAATQQLASGDLDARASESDGPPEVRELAGSFNSMAARLQQLVARQRAFAGTASHQLRTPLTALRIRLEQLASDQQLTDTSEHHVDAAISETDRLHRMIEGLLALSRAEDAALGPSEVDLSAVVHDRASHWEPLAAERGVTLRVAAPALVDVLAVPGAAEQIVDNLIDNALDVSPAGSTLAVRVVPGPSSTELHVIDSGPGLSDDDRAKAFDRFWRGAAAVPGGSGLGLAIVRQLAEAGGGGAELRASDTGGIDAVVSFLTPT